MASSILVVDDDPLIRKTLQLYLELAGHRVRLAGNGREAVAALSEAIPDVVILDIFMPEMDGFETLRQIRQPVGKARILAISGGGSREHGHFLSMAAKLGADGVLKKPFTASRLMSAVETLLGHWDC